jgi:hypothetical protein
MVQWESVPQQFAIAWEQSYRPCWRTCSCICAFDVWMAREHRVVLFEPLLQRRDRPRPKASNKPERLRTVIASRLSVCGLGLNERKTRNVYCQDSIGATSQSTHVRFPGIHVPPATVAEKVWRSVRQLPPGSQRSTAQAETAGSAALAPAPASGQDPHGPGADLQSVHPGLDHYSGASTAWF